MTEVDPGAFTLLEDDPNLLVAFEIICGERSIPPDIDNAFELRRCWYLLRSAMDRAHTQSENLGMRPVMMEQETPNKARQEWESNTQEDKGSDVLPLEHVQK